MDEGGLQKEFFLLMTDLFFHDRSIFCILNDVYLWIQPDANPDFLWLAGVLLGLAVYNNVQLDVSFPIALYKSLLAEIVHLEDIDLILAKSLNNWQEAEGHECADERLKTLLSGIESLTQGFQMVFPTDRAFIMYKCLQPSELEQLVRGKHLDLTILPTLTQYQGGYTSETPIIAWLWDLVLKDFTPLQQFAFLRFVTGSDRLPITGLSSFCIYRCGPDADRLPTSQTCFNTLLLNEYSTPQRLERYLLMAIDNSQGFGLC